MTPKKLLSLVLTIAVLTLTGCQPSTPPEEPAATQAVTAAATEAPAEATDAPEEAVEVSAEVIDGEIVEHLPSSPDTLAVFGGALYAQVWQELYKSVTGGWAKVDLGAQSSGTYEDFFAAGEGFYLLHRDYPRYDHETGETLRSDEGLFAICLMALDESGRLGAPETVCHIAWDVNEDAWPQMYGLMVADGAAYILLHDESQSDWELRALYRVDLATGKGVKVAEDYLSELTLYKDGLLVGRRFNWNEAFENGQMVKSPEIVSIDPRSGDIAVLGSMPDTSCGALLYDANTDALYYSDSSYVYRLDSAFAAEAVGYLAGANTSRSDSAAVIYQNRYWVGDWRDESHLRSATLDPALLPTRTLRVNNLYGVDNLVTAFIKEHPDVAVEYLSFYDSTAEKFRSHMTSPQAADIYSVNLPYEPYAPLLKYGLLTDISGSETLMEVIGRMYPHMTQAYLTDGKLYGLPISLSANTLGYYPKALEKAGLTPEDMPSTYEELLDFLTDWYYDYADDHEEISVFEWSPELRSTIIGMIFDSQALLCEARGEDFTFRTPTIQKLLQRIDSQEMKTVFDALGPQRDPNGGAIEAYVYAYSEDDGANAIFTSSYQPLPRKYPQWNAPEPLLLTLDEASEPTIQVSTTLLVVNKASPNQELALELLEYIAQRLPQDVTTTLMPDVNEPIEVEYYQENMKSYAESLAKLEELLEKEEDEALRVDLTDTIEWYKQIMKRTEEEERWACTAEYLAYYRESIAPHLVATASSIFTGENNPVSTLLMQYIDGNLDANSFISQIDDKVDMRRRENE